MLRRIVYPLILAALCVAVLATHVAPEFERIRNRIVTEPRGAVQPLLNVDLPDLSRLSGQPVALIFRLQGAAEPIAIRIAMDDLRVTRVLIPPGELVRVDASAFIPPGPGHRLVLAGDLPNWQLTYLEVANIYGHSSGVFEFVIVPRERVAPPVPIWLLLVTAVTALVARPRIDWIRRRTLRWLYWSAAALVVLLFTATLAAAQLSQYRILLSATTFVICAAILYLEPLVRLARASRPALRATAPRVEPYLPHLAAVALILWSVGQFHHPDTGFTSLIVFGEDFEQHAMPSLRAVPHALNKGSGYDGQFYAQIALDPLLRSPEIVTAIDDPAYRARRILLPWIAWLLGGGQPWYILQAYALLNVLCWGALGVLLVRWLPAGSLRPTLCWIAIMFSDGLLSSMRQAVPDGPSMLLIALGVAAVEKRRPWLAGGLLGLSGLARETNLLASIICTPSEINARAIRTLVVQGLLIVAPLALWSIYIWQIGIEPTSAGLRNFAPPLTAYFGKWQMTLRELGAEGWDSFSRFALLALISLTTQAIVLFWYRDWRSPWWRLGAAYAVLMLVLGPAVWEGHSLAVSRVMIPLTVAFNVMLPRCRFYWPLFILGNAAAAHGLEFMRVPWLGGL